MLAFLSHVSSDKVKGWEEQAKALCKFNLNLTAKENKKNSGVQKIC